MSVVASVHGRAGKDGELRQSQSGKPWCRLSIVCQAGTDREGQPQDCWFTLVGFGRVAEDLSKVRKGEMLSAFGRLELSKWTDQQGNNRESWQLICDEVVTVRSARPGGRAKGKDGSGSRDAQRASYEAQRPSDGVPFDDDLSF